MENGLTIIYDCFMLLILNLPELDLCNLDHGPELSLMAVCDLRNTLRNMQRKWHVLSNLKSYIFYATRHLRGNGNQA